MTSFGSLLLLKSGLSSYQNTESSGTSRWGDYCTVCTDPADPASFWRIQMYPSGPSIWSTQITQLLTSPLQLTIATAGTNALLSWPSLANGFQLEFSTALDVIGSWSKVTQRTATNGNLISVLVPASGEHQFFRLHRT